MDYIVNIPLDCFGGRARSRLPGGFCMSGARCVAKSEGSCMKECLGDPNVDSRRRFNEHYSAFSRFKWLWRRLPLSDCLEASKQID
jgi:hypothetical protein